MDTLVDRPSDTDRYETARYFNIVREVSVIVAGLTDRYCHCVLART